MIKKGEMISNEAGKMVDRVCQEMPDFIPGMHFDIFQIMPNYFHAIICLRDSAGEESKTNVGAGTETCPYTKSCIVAECCLTV